MKSYFSFFIFLLINFVPLQKIENYEHYSP